MRAYRNTPSESNQAEAEAALAACEAYLRDQPLATDTLHTQSLDEETLRAFYHARRPRFVDDLREAIASLAEK
ncbi:TPA: hypothetical protein DCE37_02905 [Candidatus Latescibacteria bacterium]|nr:hypothetical protein [Gemmatimonadota bacterium]HAA74054.1 hypothetical protein [Candidatus Latescibacterota bacterium]